MKRLSYAFFIMAALLASKTAPILAQSMSQNASAGNSAQQGLSGASYYTTNSGSNTTQTPRLGVVNTKKCLEESKLGKQEKANFEKMKLQMESVLEDKERELEEIEARLEDEDYLDSATDEVVNELKRKKRSLRNEGMQLQGQYLQTLQQANVKIVQKLTDMIGKSSEQVAQETANTSQPIEIIFMDEACTFYAPRLDVSDKIIAKMNALFDAEQKDHSSKSR